MSSTVTIFRIIPPGFKFYVVTRSYSSRSFLCAPGYAIDPNVLADRHLQHYVALRRRPVKEHAEGIKNRGEGGGRVTIAHHFKYIILLHRRECL